jgi:hypothetical protein
MLCSATQFSFRDITNAGRRKKEMQVYKCHNIYVTAVQVSLMIQTVGNSQLQQMKNTSSVCAMLWEVTNKRVSSVASGMEREGNFRGGAQNSWFLLHDNTPTHRSMMVTKYLAKYNMMDLEHSPYIPDLSPPSFFLFLWLKRFPKGRFMIIKEFTAKVIKALTEVLNICFQECFQLQTLAKMCHWPRELFWCKCYVNRNKILIIGFCITVNRNKITYLWARKQFWELFEATCIIQYITFIFEVYTCEITSQSQRAYNKLINNL